jgi:hypothetical protein
MRLLRSARKEGEGKGGREGRKEQGRESISLSTIPPNHALSLHVPSLLSP